jgi:hypothetical protein
LHATRAEPPRSRFDRRLLPVSGQRGEITQRVGRSAPFVHEMKRSVSLWAPTPANVRESSIAACIRP